jgi:hypothetical protein
LFIVYPSRRTLPAEPAVQLLADSRSSAENAATPIGRGHRLQTTQITAVLTVKTNILTIVTIEIRQPHACDAKAAMLTAAQAIQLIPAGPIML